MVDHGYCPCYRFPFYYGAQRVAVFLGHLLAVVQQRMAKTGRQYNGRGKDRPCQATPSCFIAARLREAFFKEFFHAGIKIQK